MAASILRILAASAISTFLAACGGGGDEDRAALAPTSVVQSNSSYSSGYLPFTVSDGVVTVAADPVTFWTFSGAGGTLHESIAIDFELRGIGGALSQFSAVQCVFEVYINDTLFSEFSTTTRGAYAIDSRGDRAVTLSPTISVDVTAAEISSRTGVPASSTHRIQIKRTATILQASGTSASALISGDTSTHAQISATETQP